VILGEAGGMSVERAVAVVTSLREGGWLDGDEAALVRLAALGLIEKPRAGAELPSGLHRRELEAAQGIEQPSLSSVDGEPANVTFFMGSSPEPESEATRSAYRDLVAALAASLGPPQRVWADRPSPVQWREADLDIGLQLFDRRDSVVMVWVEHRSRSQEAERRAR
jgi:hypothetical protein